MTSQEIAPGSDLFTNMAHLAQRLGTADACLFGQRAARFVAQIAIEGAQSLGGGTQIVEKKLTQQYA
jgi:hypothetical protein